MRFESTLPSRLAISIADVDPDYLLLNVSVSDGLFAGSTRTYENLDVLRRLAASLSGFPKHPQDSRECELGAFGPEMAGGGVNLRFRCVDRSGHAILEAEVEDEPTPEPAPRTVRIRMNLEPSALDEFLRTLGSLPGQVGDAAVLKGAA